MAVGKVRFAVAAISLATLCAAAAAGSCTKKAHPGEGLVSGSAPSSSASAQPASSEDAASDASQEAAAVSWSEAVRVGRWKDAARAIDALAPAVCAQPELRYVRARVALALNDPATAVRLLDQLETPLAGLAADIAFYRAQAQIHTGPLEEAARFFGSQTDARNLVRAATAWEKAARPKEARDAADRAVKACGRRTDETAIEAHVVRARLAEAAGDKSVAAADLRFVAHHDPARSDADDIGEAIARLDPANALTAPERIDRAHRLAREGKAEAAQQELDRAAQAPGRRPSAGEMAFARGMSLFLDRAHYAEAASSFEQAASLDPNKRLEATWYAAKAWARADQNDRAAARYRDLVHASPRGRWAERASYQLARLEMLEARWAEAAQSYAGYLARFARGESVESARYEQAVCTLLAGHADRARKLLAALADRQADPLSAAHLHHLEAVAAWQAGDRAAAQALWNNIARQSPLTWPAMVASARLASAGLPVPSPIQPAPSSNDAPLAVSLPPHAAMLQRLGLDRDAAEWLRDHERQWSAAYGARGNEALCQAHGQLAEARRRFSLSQRLASSSLLSSAPGVATRWAWDCTWPRPYPALVEQVESRDAIPRGLLHSIMRQESGFDPEARSHAGAVGLMQLLPSTARRAAQDCGADFDPDQLRSPAVNVDLAARYVAYLLKMFQGSLPLAAAAYNAGPKAVGRWLQRAGDVPLDLWVARIPYGETRHYVWRVMGNVARYGYLAQADQGMPRFDLKLPEGIFVGADAY
jgi:soluble lytic murein transglycosylase